MTPNQIVKEIQINAPVSRVWDALTDSKKFGEWFQVKFEGPFIAGKSITGQITYPGYEHIQWNAGVKKIEPEHTFSFTWHPYAVEPDVDYSEETPTLVEFTLKKSGDGTLLRVTESGFDRVPEHRRVEAFRMNSGGWEEQVENVKKYVE